jgi:hypothetical protein
MEAERSTAALVPGEIVACVEMLKRLRASASREGHRSSAVHVDRIPRPRTVTLAMSSATDRSSWTCGPDHFR